MTRSILFDLIFIRAFCFHSRAFTVTEADRLHHVSVTDRELSVTSTSPFPDHPTMDTKSTIKFATSPIGEALSKRQSQSTEQYSMSESTSSNGAEPSWSEPSGSPVRYTIPPSTRTTTGGLPSATLPEPPFKKPSKSPRRDRKAESEVPSYIHDGKVNWGHCSFKLVVTCALLPLLYLCWFISPFSGNWSTQAYHDRISIGHDIHAE